MEINWEKLAYNTAYHPRIQDMVERMNSQVIQMIRCLIHDIGNPKDWEKFLPTVELVINLLPNQSTSFSPLFLNYGYESIKPIQLLRGNEDISKESVAFFVQRVTSDWGLARENLAELLKCRLSIMTGNTGVCSLMKVT